MSREAWKPFLCTRVQSSVVQMDAELHNTAGRICRRISRHGDENTCIASSKSELACSPTDRQLRQAFGRIGTQIKTPEAKCAVAQTTLVVEDGSEEPLDTVCSTCILVVDIDSSACSYLGGFGIRGHCDGVLEHHDGSKESLIDL